MTLLTLDRTSDTPLTEQIILGIQKLIDNRALRSGSRMPSIRGFGDAHEVSRFTVVQAYDRLVASNYLQSRPGSGFYVTPRPSQFGHATPSIKLERAMDVLWLLRNALSQPGREPIPGAGWLPHEWMDEPGLQRSLRMLAQKTGRHLTHYGIPQGYLPLRQLLQQRLSEYLIQADTDQILLTNSATHALDLIARYFIRPGDTVLVDDPGYFLLYGTLKSYGAKIVGVPWNTDGPDIEILQQLINEHQPKLFFSNTILHNPTGASISQPVAYRLLQLAESANMIIIEDDVFGDFHPGRISRLATLDQLKRVIYISSFSKTISSAMRVGFIACTPELAQQLTDLKLLSGISTSEINERIIHQMLVSGHYRKYLNKLHKRLQQSKELLLENFESLGLSPDIDPEGGMFIWVNMPDHINVIEMSNRAARQGIILAPGNLFKPHQAPCQWMRFNVASSHEA
ncbi:MAG: PLP-dependent aminotransferase family protein, partial [Gammaproteobacteria bacterium]|nr:PLP-dependent aminotransferase family protein [Gammaproteobacteria bacterium]